MSSLWSQWFNGENAMLMPDQNLNLKYMEWVDYKITLQNHRGRNGDLKRMNKLRK